MSWTWRRSLQPFDGRHGYVNDVDWRDQERRPRTAQTSLSIFGRITELGEQKRLGDSLCARAGGEGSLPERMQRVTIAVPFSAVRFRGFALARRSLRD